MLRDLAQYHPLLPTLAGAALLLVGALLAYWLTKRILLAIINGAAKRTSATWDDALVNQGVFSRLSHVVPALIIHRGVHVIPGMTETLATVVVNVVNAYLVVMVVAALAALLSAVNEVYEQRPESAERPIKGFIQIAKLALYIVGGILVIAAVMDKSPVILLSGLGAITAVLLIVFKDTLLSLAASIQLTSQKLVRVGDWIEVPRFGADGDVIDVALYTITVRNWDKTITTIPSYQLVSGSFKNWRGMEQAGGRRIKRSVLIDVSSLRFLSDDEVKRFARFDLLKDYIPAKQDELQEYNDGLEADKDAQINLRRLTNIGTLRAYIFNFLKNHPKIHEDMVTMVRQLPPGPTGLPLEVYCFSSDTDWVHYEGIQADIFDHICAIVPAFGLRLYQQPAGSDLAAVSKGLATRTPVPEDDGS